MTSKPEVCYGCGKSDPPPTGRNIAGMPVHVRAKCMKRAWSRDVRLLPKPTK